MKREQQLEAEGTPVFHDGRTVGEWLDYWVENIAPKQVRQTTLIRHKQQVRLHLKPALGKKTLFELSVMDVQNMIDKYIANGGSPRMAQITRNVLSAALRTAMRREIIHRNVSRLVEIPHTIYKERNVWNPEQIKIFLTHIQGHAMYPIFAMLFTYGLRRGEALGLRWCDIDFDKKLICIRQQLIEIAGQFIIGEPKSSAGKRELPMLPHIEVILAELRAKSPDNAPEGFIFRTSTGTHYQPSNVYKVFKREINNLGLPDISIHDIRHTVATLMKDNNVPVKDAQMTLGHANIQTTLQIYQHSSIENKNKALISVANAFLC